MCSQLTSAAPWHHPHLCSQNTYRYTDTNTHSTSADAIGTQQGAKPTRHVAGAVPNRANLPQSVGRVRSEGGALVAIRVPLSQHGGAAGALRERRDPTPTHILLTESGPQGSLTQCRGAPISQGTLYPACHDRAALCKDESRLFLDEDGNPVPHRWERQQQGGEPHPGCTRTV